MIDDRVEGALTRRGLLLLLLQHCQPLLQPMQLVQQDTIIWLMRLAGQPVASIQVAGQQRWQAFKWQGSSGGKLACGRAAAVASLHVAGHHEATAKI